MIGSFLYSSRPRPDDVTVWLESRDGRFAARIALPDRLADMMSKQGYPPPAPKMSIEAALSYAIFIAIRSHAGLAICGDRTAWNPAWGYLTDLGQFPTTGFIAESNRARE